MKNTALILSALFISGCLYAQEKTEESSEKPQRKIETIKIIDGDTLVHDVRIVETDMDMDELKDRMAKREKRMEEHKMRMEEHRMMMHEMDDELSEEIEEILEDLDIYVSLDEHKKKMIVKRMIIKDDEVEELIEKFEGDEDMIIDMSGDDHTMKVIKIQIDKDKGEELKVVEIKDKDGKMHRKEVRREYGDDRERTRKDDPLKIYPNPANNELNLAFEVREGKPVEVTVMDMDGEKVFNKTYKEAGKVEETVNLKGKKKGMYVVRLMDVNRTVSKQIIVE